ncbi:DUF1524 domain-containing protein [Cellulomonas sp.]|uniref:GmrSD restriction endonuclease domain-containing protein n=1 Tax=Cellulomonas sp. TaxID=40001 RepID=UPI0025C60CBC|nr:DUF1524 domain-containing protein [Cellulomonas sp.]
MRAAALGIALVAAVALTAGCEDVASSGAVAAAANESAAATPAPDADAAVTTDADVPAAATAPDVTVAGDDARAAAVAAASAHPTSALGTVALLTVKGRAPKTGYDRDQFGPAWQDVDRNGCDTRNDVLRRDLTAAVLKAGTHDCVVLSGTLADPYSGRTIAYVRGQDTSASVQIDHVVALSDAWQKGAQQWDVGRRTALGNDPLNLLAVDGPLNGQKGDGDAATWLPPNKAYRCAYVARQVAVKYTYGLWVTAAERDAMVSVLSTCPDEPLPAGSAVPPTAAPTALEPPPAPAPAAVAYASCAEAWAAGAAPVHAADPGYATHLDRDGDGVGCETRP